MSAPYNYSPAGQCFKEPVSPNTMCPIHGAMLYGLGHKTWTTELVQQYLPDVPVRLGDCILQGRTSGRGNDFATVCFNGPDSVVVGGLHNHIQAPWWDLANILNQNREIVLSVCWESVSTPA